MSHRTTHLTHDDETICPDCGMDISQWHENPCPKMQREIEKLARQCHEVYQTEAKRQRDSGELNLVDDALGDNEPSLRHPDDYDELSEEFKNFDRALARFILTNFKSKEDVEIWISKRPICGNCGATLFCGKCEPVAKGFVLPIKREDK